MTASCATVLAETLHRLGVRHVFGHPGGEVVDLIEALERGGVRFVVDWAAVARGFGAHGLTVTELGDLDKAIRDWLAEPRLTVLAVDETLYTGLTY